MDIDTYTIGSIGPSVAYTQNGLFCPECCDLVK